MGALEIAGIAAGLLIAALAVWSFVVEAKARRKRARTPVGASCGDDPQGKIRKHADEPQHPPSISSEPRTGFLGVPRRNPIFIGREELLGELRAALEKEGQAALTQALVGSGGVGKTQLAIEYAHRFADRYAHIIWVDAEELETLTADMLGAAVAMGLVPKGTESTEGIEALLRELAGRDDWLVVFDNAPAPKALRDYIPSSGGGHVLVTSRNPAWHRVGGEPLQVEPFEAGESLEFLGKRTGRKDTEGAGEVAKELGHLPLALEQAGAYIEETGISFGEYVEMFRTRRQELWSKEHPPDDYAGTVATTWTLALDKLKDSSPSSIELLRLMAFLGPVDIPLVLLEKGVEVLPEELAQAVTDSVKLNEALGGLIHYGLIQREEDALAIHRLTQAVVRDALGKDGRHRWASVAVKLVAKAFDFKKDDLSTWPLCERLLPHVGVVVARAEEEQAFEEPLGRLLNDAGLCLQSRVELPLAKRYAERSVALYERTHGPDHPHVAATVNNLGSVLHDQGDLEGAKAALERALGIDEKVYGPDHPEVATDVNNLGSVLQAQGDLEGAKAALERALKIIRARYGEDHPSVAIIQGNLDALSTG